jgi:hypothetical protein
MGFLSWLEGTAYSQWIVAGLLGWPLMLSMHAIGLAAIVGIMFAINLRMLGLFKPIPYTGLGALLRFGWVGIAVNAFSGLSLFMAQATFYVTSVPFLFKITFVILGIANLHVTQRVLRQEAESWQETGVISRTGTLLAASSIAFWTLAVVFGRLIAYL